MRVVESKKNIIVIVVWLFMIIPMIFYIVYLHNQHEIINNPTFVGEIIGKESVIHRVGASGVIGVTEYRLHIAGEYIKNNKTIQVNRVFIVSADIYNQHEVGDIISHRWRFCCFILF